jgi:integrase
MPTIKLTAIGIPTLKPGEYWDASLPGLGLRVGKSRRTWVLRFRAGGRNPRHTLGHFPAMSLADARKAAGKASERIDAGSQPAAPAAHPRSPDALTLGSLIDRYEKLREREGHQTKTLHRSMRALRLGLASSLGMQASEFSKTDLRAARDAVADDGHLAAANRLLAYLGPVMRWAAQEDLVPGNFVADIRRAPEAKRSRVLTRAEIAAIWKACGELGEGASAKAFGRMVRFLLATAQRRDEAASLKHGDILDGRWRQIDNKSDRVLTLKLPPLALHLVGKGKAQEFAFGAVTGGKISGFSKLKRALDERSGVTEWRLHDLRRTAATNMQELGVAHHVIEAVLNHAIPGVAGVYLRGELEEQKAAALIEWQAELERIIGMSHHTAVSQCR